MNLSCEICGKAVGVVIKGHVKRGLYIICAKCMVGMSKGSIPVPEFLGNLGTRKPGF